jgi:hypothetical protein
MILHLRMSDGHYIDIDPESYKTESKNDYGIRTEHMDTTPFMVARDFIHISM